MIKEYKGTERRKFVRLDYVAPFSYKVCKQETISQLLKGYTANVSPVGILCNIAIKVQENDIVWLSFDRTTLDIFKNMEKMCLIYQGGVIGKVVRVEAKNDGLYDIGVQFITREEENSSYIYPRIHFLKEGMPIQDDEEEA